MTREVSNFEIDPSYTELSARTGAAAAPAPINVPQTGAIHSIDGLLGPNLLLQTGAPLNNIAVQKVSAGDTITFSITGVGTMAQRNAAAAVADIATPDATDLASAITLANANKAKINALLAALRAAGHLTP